MTFPVLPTRWVIPATDQANDPNIFPFLTGQSFLQLKSAIWSTRVDTANSGVERRRQLWAYPNWKFTVAYEVIRDAPALLEWQTLIAFFNAHAGSTQGFFYFDRSDHQVTGMPFGTGDGSTTSFQLSRTMTVGGITFTEPVRGISGTPTIYVNGTPTTAYSIGSLGALTFTSAPAAGATLTWDGNFFFLCRFAADNLDLQQVMSGLWSNTGLDLVTFKV